MNDFLPFIVIGATSGSVFAIAALGLVLTYKTSGIFNFAHGAVAAGGAYSFYELWQVRGVPWPVAGFAVVFVAAPLFGLLMERLSRRLEQVSTAPKIVATVGLLVAIQGIAVSIYGSAALNFPRFLPTTTYEIASVNVGADQLITMALALVAAAGLSMFFRLSRLGTAMRSVVDDPDLLSLTGTSPVRVRAAAWMIGSSFAALSGVLIAPTLGLDAVLLTLLVVQAFGAAAVGSFASLPLTYVGGLVIGVGAGLSTKYVTDFPALAGFPTSFPFLVLFVALLFLPKDRLVEARSDARRAVRDRRALSSRTRVGAVTVGLLVLVAVPHLVGARLPVYTSSIVYALLFASLALLVRTSGQVSLCHAAFAAVGATSFSHLAVGVGLPWPLALLIAGLVTVPVGAVVAIPAIRLSGLFLALATFGFAVLVERLLYGTGIMFGAQGTRLAPRPSFAAGDTGYYYVVLAIALAGILLCGLVARTRLGRLLRAMADSSTALTTAGADVNVSKVLVFCISAFLAGVSGALYASLFGSISTVTFNSFLSLTLLVVLFIAGSRQYLSPFIASVLLFVLPSYSATESLREYQPVIFGLGAVLVAVNGAGGVDWGARFSDAAERARGRSARGPVHARNRAPRAAELDMGGAAR
jgi:branched-subunit amino acid ABC-type transport system permease component